MNKITLREELIMLTILNLHEGAYLKKSLTISPLLPKKRVNNLKTFKPVPAYRKGIQEGEV